MKVYIVWEGDNSYEMEIVGVYVNKDAAERYCKNTPIEWPANKRYITTEEAIEHD